MLRTELRVVAAVPDEPAGRCATTDLQSRNGSGETARLITAAS